jgi:hemin uptake protein HemP
VHEDHDCKQTAAKRAKAAPGDMQEPVSFPVVPVETILAGAREATLIHNNVSYRLRITSNGKLILTK